MYIIWNRLHEAGQRMSKLLYQSLLLSFRISQPSGFYVGLYLQQAHSLSLLRFLTAYETRSLSFTCLASCLSSFVILCDELFERQPLLGSAYVVFEICQAILTASALEPSIGALPTTWQIFPLVPMTRYKGTYRGKRRTLTELVRKTGLSAGMSMLLRMVLLIILSHCT